MYLQQQLNERQWDYDLVSLAADARVTDDGNLVGLQVPRTCEAASWEPNDVYDELRHAGFSGCSEEDQEETFNRFLKPAAPPDSGNGVVVPHEAPGGAEVRGVDWLEPISESLAKALKQAWSDVCVVVAFAARYTPTLPLRYRAPILNLR